MKNEKLFQQIRQHAERDVPDLTSKIKHNERFLTPTKRPSFTAFFKRPVPVFSALSLVLVVLFIFILTPSQDVLATSTVYLEINPAIQIDLDEDDQVLRIIPLNEDASELIKELNSTHRQDVIVAIDKIIEKAIEKGYLSEEHPVVLFDILSNHSNLVERLNTRIQDRIPEIAQQRLPNLDMVRGNAHSRDDENNAIHPGQRMRHNLILTLLDMYPDEFTYEELSTLSMGELRRLMTEHNADEDTPPNRPPMPNRPN